MCVTRRHHSVAFAAFVDERLTGFVFPVLSAVGIMLHANKPRSYTGHENFSHGLLRHALALADGLQVWPAVRAP